MAKRVENGDGRPTHEQIAERAWALYEASGRRPGHDVENWLAAEAELLRAHKAGTGESKPAYKQLARPASQP